MNTSENVVVPTQAKRKRGGPFIDRTGQRFGMLVAVRRAPNQRPGTVAYECQCDCGTVKIVPGSALGAGQTNSCGCLRAALNVQRKTTHGQSYSREYAIWNGMKARCSNPNHLAFHRYGGRGIKVCERWFDSFENFFADMGVAPKGMGIERTDNDGNYEPSNCKWADAFEQCANQSTNVRLMLNGETHHVAEWARITGLKTVTIFARIRLGWDVEKAILTPTRPKKSHPPYE